MKSKTWMVMASTLGLVGVCLAGGQKWDVPYWDNTQSNPYTNADGVVWSVRGATNNIGYAGDPTPGALYAEPVGLMTWLDNMWQGQVAGSQGVRPMRVNFGSYTLRSSMCWEGLLYPAALMIRVPKSGEYSLYGTLMIVQSEGGSADVRIGHYDADNAWHPLYENLYTFSAGGGITRTTNLTAIAAMQKMKLAEGDLLALIITAYNWYYTPALDFTGSGDPVGIEWIPPRGSVICIQ